LDWQDAERQGNWFKPSTIEVDIIEHAQSLLHSKKAWHRNDNRICTQTDSHSLFCALFQASITVDGEYRHLRPAVKFVRDIIEERHPKTYDHVLVEFNNASSISYIELHKVLTLTKERLLQQIPN